MFKVLSVCIVFLITSCNLASSVDENKNLSNDSNRSLNVDKIKLSQENRPNCDNLKRSLNPPNRPTSSETVLDRHFRLAFSSETGGNFDQAIFHYREAAKLANCDCDLLHAEAGKTAAEEAKELLEQEGMKANPTQFFWGRLQQLTETLPCVGIN